MILKHAGCNASERTFMNKLHQNGIWFHTLREKPTLSENDVKQRFRFAKANYKIPAEKWVEPARGAATPHAIIDNKRYAMYLDNKGRSHAAKRGVRGIYRTSGDAVAGHMVKPKASLKYPAQGIMVSAGVIRGRIRMWHYIEGRWNAKKAAAMYRGPLMLAMAKTFPENARKPHAKWVVLEDNDPAGYKSGEAEGAKAEVGIKVKELPCRSPDLNVLDYSLWKAIEKRMRSQERAFPKSKKETVVEFKARLRKTALGLPESVVKKAVMSMKRRLTQIVDAKGGLIEE